MNLQKTEKNEVEFQIYNGVTEDIVNRIRKDIWYHA